LQKITIKIPNCEHLVEWLRFIVNNRNSDRSNAGRLFIFDFRQISFLFPYHLTSLACLIEEYRLSGARIRILYREGTDSGNFIKYSKFDQYWTSNSNRNYCLKARLTNTMPIWKHKVENIDAFAGVIQNFYAAHSLKEKDLTPLRLTVVEALNNITDHSESKVSGFIATQFYKQKSELCISICDFGKGIPNKVNEFIGDVKGRLDDSQALQKALELGFSTKSNPHNRGFGLDIILTIVKANKGEITIVSNRAFYSKQIQSVNVKSELDNLAFSFPGTYLVIKLNTSHFQLLEAESSEEVELF